MRHDLHSAPNAQPALQCAFVMHHTAIPNFHFSPYQHLMSALEAMPNTGVGIHNTATADDGVVADPGRLRVSRVTVSENNIRIDLGMLTDLNKGWFCEFHG
jgi:hypothetical protein